MCTKNRNTEGTQLLRNVIRTCYTFTSDNICLEYQTKLGNFTVHKPTLSSLECSGLEPLP